MLRSRLQEQSPEIVPNVSQFSGVEQAHRDRMRVTLNAIKSMAMHFQMMRESHLRSLLFIDYRTDILVASCKSATREYHTYKLDRIVNIKSEFILRNHFISDEKIYTITNTPHIRGYKTPVFELLCYDSADATNTRTIFAIPGRSDVILQKFHDEYFIDLKHFVRVCIEQGLDVDIYIKKSNMFHKHFEEVFKVFSTILL